VFNREALRNATALRARPASSARPYLSAYADQTRRHKHDCHRLRDFGGILKRVGHGPEEKQRLAAHTPMMILDMEILLPGTIRISKKAGKLRTWLRDGFQGDGNEKVWGTV
jgi:hypothetical protein